MGDTHQADGHTIRDRVAGALRRLGEGQVVDAVLEAFAGRYELLKEYDGDHQDSVVIALSDALDGLSCVHSAGALAEIHAVEALPRLREMLRRTGKRNPTSEAIAEAIQELESRASLPRPADSVDAPAETLPRAAAEPGSDTSTLPKVVDD